MNWLSKEILAALPCEESLGSGSSAEVFSADYEGMPLALKWARPGHEKLVAVEAERLLRLQQAHIPRLVGVAERDGRPLLALERAQGSPLSPSWPARDRQPEALRDLLLGVGSALREMHVLGVAHGDVKPENILYSTGVSAQLFDLGLSHRFEESSRGGTPAYLSLEPRATAEERDIFAFLLVLAELVDARLRGRMDPGRLQETRWPEQLGSAVRSWLDAGAGLRPGIDWLLRQGGFLEAGGKAALRSSASAASSHSRLRSTYLEIRAGEWTTLLQGRVDNVKLELEGSPREWTASFFDLHSVLAPWLTEPSVQPSLESSRREEGLETVVGGLAPLDRRRFVAKVVGTSGLHTAAPKIPDHLLVERLEQALVSEPWGGLSPQLLREGVGLEHRAESPGPVQKDPVSIALALGHHPVSPSLLRLIEGDLNSPVGIRAHAAAVLRRAGHYRRALLLVPGEEQEELLQRALLFFRLERVDLGVVLAQRVSACRDLEIREQGQALIARALLDEGRADEAQALVSEARTAPAREVRALLCLQRGELQLAEEEIVQGLAASRDEEQRARLAGVEGLLAHHQGQSDRARAAFLRATEAASRVGAILEEATYQTGLSAASADAGYLQVAQESAQRAQLLFEAIGRPDRAARAVLNEASVLSLVGSSELGTCIARGLALAGQSADEKCIAYLLLSRAEILPGPASEAVLVEAQGLLGSLSPDDELRVLTRRLKHDGSHAERGDALAALVASPIVLAEWWGARARRAAQSSDPSKDAQVIVAQLASLLGTSAQLPSLGPALVEGASLALAVGERSQADRFLAGARGIAGRLLRFGGGKMRPLLRSLAWIERCQAQAATQFQPEQLADVEGLLRALGQTENLRDLLRQVLDLLLLWTSVERGLILLTAPGDKLVVRAARNLSKTDLETGQLSLSLSMARRAMAEGKAVTAVDPGVRPADASRSMHALRLRSVLAVPLVARGRIFGVAYLDDRVRARAFGEKELAWANLIGTIAAFALGDARDRLDLRRAVRRATAAEARAERDLVNTRGELELAERRLKVQKDRQSLTGNYGKIVGAGPKMAELLHLVERVAAVDVPVLISGESGSGKELIARAIVDNGARRESRFVVENCGAVPETLLESTLFGHKKGAFTGATRDRRGLFELADGGTLFLDEIGEMSLSMQTKLLRVLSDGRVRPVGGERDIAVDVRLIAATHRDLKSMVAEGSFREDLFYRLSVVPVHVPPLRERPEDVDALVDHFVRLHDPQGERSLSAQARERLRSYKWPGNVRQLENEVRRMLVLGGQHLSVADVGVALSEEGGAEARTLREKVDALERSLVLEALDAHRGNRTRSAAALGVSRYGLQKMMARLDIEPPTR